MLSRHFLRTKVLQSLYSSEYGMAKDVITAEKNFTHNISRLNDLGLLQVSSMVHLWEMAKVMIEEGRNKFMPSMEEKNPSMRMLNNEFLRRISDNFEFRHQMEECHVNWSDEEDLFRKNFTALRKTDFYKEYVAKDPEETSVEGRNLWEEDKLFAINLFKYMMTDEALVASYVERSLWWEDDFFQVAQYVMMFLKTLQEDSFDESSMWPMVYDNRNAKEQEDMDFAHLLLFETIRHRNESDELIKSHLKGWEFERVAMMDVLMLNMAITELTECASIPEKVTVDEYIELSKEFSSDKSKLFINGILDKLILELRSQGKIKKSGRGILEL